MLRVTEREVSALNALSHSPDFQIVVEWMKRTLDAHDSEIRTQIDDVMLRQQQGKAQELAEIINHVDTANELLHRMRK